MFNKVKSIFGKNSKRLKSVLTSFLLGVGCTGTSLANPKSVSLSTEKRTANSENLVNTYIRLIGKQYESIIETSLNGTESIKTYKNNRSIKRVIENDNNKNKNKQNSQSISKKDVSNNTILKFR